MFKRQKRQNVLRNHLFGGAVLLNIGELRDAVGETCDREFELPVIKGDRSVRLCEKTAYSVESACSQIPADNEKLCGDTFESFTTAGEITL